MTEHRKRDLALKAYLQETCPSTKQQILGMIWAERIKVIWSRGVIKLKVVNDSDIPIVKQLVADGHKQTAPRRTEFVRNGSRLFPNATRS